MAKVFVVNQPKDNPRSAFGSYDVSPATQFGEVHFVFTEDDFPSPSADLKSAIAHAWKALKDFDPAEDFVVWAGGDPISMLLVAPILFEKEASNGCGIRYLKFERGRGGDGEKTSKGYYIPKTVDLFDEEIML